MQVVFVIVLEVVIAAFTELTHAHELRRLYHLGTEVIQPPYLHVSDHRVTAIHKEEDRGCLSADGGR